MAQPNVNAFIKALHKLEHERKLGDLLKCFHDDAELSNPNVTVGPGVDATRRFWQSYRQTFDTVHSAFRHVVCDDKCALLEWTSDCRTPEGHEFEYSGVSVLEFEDDRIKRFRAYFDPSDVGEQFEEEIKEREREAVAQQLQ